MIRIAILEDEQSYLDTIRNYLTMSDDMIEPIKLFEFSDLPSLRKFANPYSFDIYILDIEVNEENSLEFAKKLRSVNLRSKIIITTSHEKYAFESFMVDVQSYLKKPIQKTELIRQINKAIQLLQTSDQWVRLTDEKRAVDVLRRDILYVRTARGETLVYLLDQSDDPLRSTDSLKIVIRKVGNDILLPISSSIAVNRYYVRRINHKIDTVLLVFDIELEGSRNGMKAFRRQYAERLLRDYANE
ncbi:MAG: response regulator [Tissierellia bacterium]|nr:response regulator [Tissierellia bacterium]